MLLSTDTQRLEESQMAAVLHNITFNQFKIGSHVTSSTNDVKTFSINLMIFESLTLNAIIKLIMFSIGKSRLWFNFSTRFSRLKVIPHCIAYLYCAFIAFPLNEWEKIFASDKKKYCQKCLLTFSLVTSTLPTLVEDLR